MGRTGRSRTSGRTFFFADVCRLFCQLFRRVFTEHVGLFMPGFLSCFFFFVGMWGPFTLVFGWVIGWDFVAFGLGFHGFWAVSVAGKEEVAEVAEVAVTSLLISRWHLFCTVLARRVTNGHNTSLFLLPHARGYRVPLP